MKKCCAILAAYNAADYIETCLACFKALDPCDGWEYELVIGVDGCEKTAAKLRALNIPFYWSPENVGAYVLRNSLIEKSPADMYAVIDADDKVHPDYLSSLIPLADAHGLAGPGLHIVDDQDRTITDFRPFLTGVAVFRRDVFEALGGFRPDRVSCDFDFILRANLAGFGAVSTTYAVLDYVKHAKSLTCDVSTGNNSEYRRHIEAAHELERIKGVVKVDLVTTPLILEGVDIYKHFKDCSVVIAAPSSCEYRKRDYIHVLNYLQSLPFGEIITVTGTEDEHYNKSALYHTGVKKAKGKYLFFRDADCVCDKRALARAVNEVAGGNDWATPTSHVVRLTNDESETFVNGGLVRPINAQYVNQLAGGAFVVTREFWDKTGGFDTRFNGWGGEDSAYSQEMMHHGNGFIPDNQVLIHLWHPPQKTMAGNQNISVNDGNNKLWAEYHKAFKSKQGIENLLQAKGRECQGQAERLTKRLLVEVKDDTSAKKDRSVGAGKKARRSTGGRKRRKDSSSNGRG